MKIIHLPFSFYPDPVGGSEIYVLALAQILQARGMDVVIAAAGEAAREYRHGGVRIRRFATRPVKDVRELYGAGEEMAANEFTRLLEEEQPDVVHLHAFTSQVSLRLVRAARSRKIRVVWTCHVPSGTCLRGTMMRWGTEPCDGLMDVHACAGCTLDGLLSNPPGARQRLAPLVGALPPALGAWLGRRGLQGGMWTALRMTELVKLRHETTRELLAAVDHVVAKCEWMKQVLLRNGVPDSKLTMSRYGVAVKAEVGSEKSEVRGQRPEVGTSAFPSQTPDPRPQTPDPRPHPPRLCFLGRFDPAKGVHLLIEALRSIPQVALQLDLYGVVQGEAGNQYEQRLRRLAQGDGRIRFCPPVPAPEILGTLIKYDLLVVPSQWLETGPLVVLEAFEAGVPVLGSQLGGIAELVRDGVDGILVQAGSLAAWAAALRRLEDEPPLLETLRLGIRPPRTMGGVTDDMLALYHSVLNQKT